MMKKIATSIDSTYKKAALQGQLPGVSANEIDEMVQVKRAFLSMWLDNELVRNNVRMTKGARYEVLSKADEAIPGTALLSCDEKKFASICDKAISIAINETMHQVKTGSLKFAQEGNDWYEPSAVQSNPVDAQEEFNMSGMLGVNPVERGSSQQSDADALLALLEQNLGIGEVSATLDERKAIQTSIPDYSSWTSQNGSFGTAPSVGGDTRLAHLAELTFINTMTKIAEVADQVKASLASDEKAAEIGNAAGAALDKAPANKDVANAIEAKDPKLDDKAAESTQKTEGATDKSVEISAKYSEDGKVTTGMEGDVKQAGMNLEALIAGLSKQLGVKK